MDKGLIVTFGLTYGGAVASLFRPFVGLLIYVCFAIIRPEAMWFWSVPRGNYSRIVAIALLAGWLIQGLGKWQFGKAKWTIYALVGFWVWALLSGLQAPDSDRAFGFLEMMAKIILPFVVGLTIIDSVHKLKCLAWTIVLSQGYVAYELNMAYLGGFNRLLIDGFGGMDNNCVAIAMVTGTALAFFLGLGAKTWWQQGLAFLSAAMMAHTVLFAMSRGGMIALILTGVMALSLIRLETKHYLSLGVAALLGLRLAGPEVRERFLSVFADAAERDASAQSRLELWSNCLDAISKRPFLGLGPSHWPLIVAQYGWPSGKEAHTLWLTIGAELGLVGLLWLLAFYLITMVNLWPIARRKVAVPDPWLHDAAAMVVAALFGFMISAQFVSLVGLELPYYAAMLGAGVLRVSTLPLHEDDFLLSEAVETRRDEPCGEYAHATSD
jgi:probable O-glycosylation ligase (exosortase A-associated)